MTTRIQDLDDIGFDPFAGDELVWGDIEDPYPRAAELRKQASVHPSELRSLYGDTPDLMLSHLQTYSVFGYDDVATVLTSPETFSNGVLKASLGTSFGRTIVVMDPPEHTRYRRIFQKAFLPNIIRNWSDHLVDPVIDELIAEFENDGQVDLVRQFTLLYPFRIIYRQLDLPQEDIAIFHRLAMSQLYWADPRIPVEAGRKLGAYFDDMVEVRRENPGNDIVSLLAAAEIDGEFLPKEVLTSFLRQLVNAAGDTTYRATSTMFAQLLRHPDQLEAVRQDRSLVPRAVEETMRWDGPIFFNWRITTRDVTLSGVDIPANTVINVVQGAANRDETRFPDPDKFDIHRTSTSRHFGFGSGPHVCIGQHLARLEMTRALNAILDRLPDIRLDPSKPAPRSSGFMLRSPAHVHAVFGRG